jgi:hypothetical protein
MEKRSLGMAGLVLVSDSAILNRVLRMNNTVVL